MKILLLLSTICMISVSTQAMSVNDIPGLNANVKLSDLKRTVSEYIEPYYNRTVENLNSPVSVDSLQKQLSSVIATLDSMENKFPQILLFKALMWHYLSVLNVDSASSRCNSITKKLISSYPDYGEAVWLQSLSMIQSGQYFSGLKKLDSISSLSTEKNPGIMSDYYKLALSLLLPEMNVGTDSSIQLYSSGRNYALTPLEQEESSPKNQSWHSVSKKEKGKSSLSFSLGCNFLLRKEFPLDFYSGLPTGHPLLKLEVNNEILRKVIGPLVFDVDETPWKAEMKIVVDISESRISLNEFMFKLVSNRFDAIKETNDASRIGGISLRCYNQSIYSNVPGDYYAFIAFDMPVGRFNNNYHIDRKKSSSEPIVARYLICLKTKRCVENKAEEILQMVLSKFN